MEVPAGGLRYNVRVRGPANRKLFWNGDRVPLAGLAVFRWNARGRLAATRDPPAGAATAADTNLAGASYSRPWWFAEKINTKSPVQEYCYFLINVAATKDGPYLHTAATVPSPPSRPSSTRCGGSYCVAASEDCMTGPQHPAPCESLLHARAAEAVAPQSCRIV